MPDTADSHAHVKPFVYETPDSKALHFTISQIQSRMQTQRPYALDLDYTRTMMAMLLFNSAPENLVMIGLGGGSLAKFCHRHLPGTRIKVVEINPHVIALRELGAISAAAVRAIRTAGATLPPELVSARASRRSVQGTSASSSIDHPSARISSRIAAAGSAVPSRSSTGTTSSRQA